MNDKPTRIIIPQAGISTGDSRPRAVYDHRSSKLMGTLGEVITRRASNVESGSTLSQQALAILVKVGFATLWKFLWWKSYKILPEYANHWFADMTLSGSDTVLGPYPPDARDTALQDEVAWLTARHIPACYDCGSLKQDKPTGRTSSKEPNFQHVTRQIPKPASDREFVNVDLSATEARILSHYRREVGEKLFAELESGTVCAVNGWEEDGATLRRTFFVADDPRPSKRQVFVIVFDPASTEVVRSYLAPTE